MTGFLVSVLLDPQAAAHELGSASAHALAGADPSALARFSPWLCCSPRQSVNVRNLGGAAFFYSHFDSGAPGSASESEHSESPQQSSFVAGDQIYLVADARLDARVELISALRASAAPFAQAASPGDSDSQLILRAYTAWGETCAERLLGDFSFVLWDAPRRRLFAARDPLGIRPLYFARAGAELILSNSVHALRAYPGISSRLHAPAILDFLLFGCNQDVSTTPYAEIFRLPPAHSLLAASGAWRKQRYWQFTPSEPLRFHREEDCFEEFRSLLDQAVKDRLDETSVALLMSGGLDSTSIAAIAARIARQQNGAPRLRAFTASYEELFADPEPQSASIAASALHIPLELVGVGTAQLFRTLRRGIPSPEPLEEPLAAFDADFHLRAAAHSSVALAGEGGDILFHPQSGPYAGYLARRGEFARLISEFGTFIWQRRAIPAPRLGLKSGFRRLGGSSAGRETFPAWLAPELAAGHGLYEDRGKIQETQKGNENPVHPYRPAALEALLSSFWASLFESQHHGATRIPLEIRMPLLDLRIVSWALRLPPVPWCADKYLLRGAMRGALPDEVRLRPKTPLASDPVALLWGRDAANFLRDFVPTRGLREFVRPEWLQEGKWSSLPAPEWLRILSLDFWLRAHE